MIEEHLQQHRAVARIYSGAVATLRVHTLNVGGTAEAVLPRMVKFGSKGADTSNDWAIEAFVDRESGILLTDGVFQGLRHRVPDETFVLHPDTGAQFRGSTLPFAQESEQLAVEAALQTPEVPFVGWDIVLTPDGPVIIEGNAASMFLYSWQVLTRNLLGQHGMRSDLNSILRQFLRAERRARK